PALAPLSLHDALPICDHTRIWDAHQADVASGVERATIAHVAGQARAARRRVLLRPRRAARRSFDGRLRRGASDEDASERRSETEDRKSTRLNSSHVKS